jgi:outer membrane lipase/esterase
LNAVPSLAGGSNFAFGGATSQTLPDTISPSPSIEEQLDLWQSTTLNEADPDGLYFVQGGGNDIRLTGILPDVAEQGLFLQNSANSVGGVVEELIDAGANNIAVFNAPDLGLTPEAILGGFSPQATALSQIYNNSLEQALDSLDTEKVNIIEVDLFGFIRSITDDPTAFGLPTDTVTDASCISADSVCSNPDEFIFYDGIHPTTITHLALANVVNQQIHDAAPIPEPSTLLLTLGSVLVLVKRKNQSANTN